VSATCGRRATYTSGSVSRDQPEGPRSDVSPTHLLLDPTQDRKDEAILVATGGLLRPDHVGERRDDDLGPEDK
jgi:hypothetical protein